MSNDNITAAVQSLADKAIAQAMAKRQDELSALHAAGQLALWPDSDRGIPNELVRCAVFSAKNRKEPRVVYTPDAPLVVPVIGGGQVIYIGQELRQDDETVWMQLVHLAKESRSDWIEFTPSRFIESLHWPIKGASYTRLLTSIRRLATSGIEVYSSRFNKGVSAKLIAKYEYSNINGRVWRVQVFSNDDSFLLLFDRLYSRLHWDTRLTLNDGVATWLHGFFSSHREPFAHKIETLACAAGLVIDVPGDENLDDVARTERRKVRLREIKRTITKALENLVNIGFLESYEITRAGLVHVVRASKRPAET